MKLARQSSVWSQVVLFGIGATNLPILQKVE
jgi:hypothetical protein